MLRDFPDDLLSALIDDELTPEQRKLVEQQLANSAADQQLLAELKSLRSDLKLLPQVSLDPDFADRVVRLAMAAAENSPPGEAAAQATAAQATAAQSTAVPPAAAAGGRGQRWVSGLTAIAAVATAIAAGLLIFFQLWGDSPPEPLGPGRIAVVPKKTPARKPPEAPAGVILANAPIAAQIAAIVRQASVSDGDVLVFRLELGGASQAENLLDAALAKAGIAALPGNAPPIDIAPSLVRDYRRQLAQKLTAAGSKTDPAAFLQATEPASDALFVEAPLDQLQTALTTFASAVHRPLHVTSEARIGLPKAEGEFDRRHAVRPFVQHLEAGLFRLEKSSAPSIALAAPPIAAQGSPAAQAPVRVLILIERD